MIRTSLVAALCATGLATGLATALPAQAQGTVRIGLVLTLSGQFADAGNQIDNGIKTYMKQHGDSVAGKKIEIIRKDTGGVAPDVAKRLTFMRPDHFVRWPHVVPTVAELKIVFLAALKLVQPGAERFL